MSRTYAFLAGEYRTWRKERWIEVPKFCKKALVRGLEHALENGKIRKISVKIGSNEITDYTIVGDRVIFDKILQPKHIDTKVTKVFGLIRDVKVETKPKSYLLSVSITYEDII